METSHLAQLRAPFKAVWYDGTSIGTDQGWFHNLQKDDPRYRDVSLLHYHCRSLAAWLSKSIDGAIDDDGNVKSFSVDLQRHRWSNVAKGGWGNTLNYTDADLGWLHSRHELLLASLGY